MKDAKEHLRDFLEARPNEEWPSAELQRMEWKNEDGTLATPRSIVRRLQELTEEGKIKNVGTPQGAIYTVSGAPKRKEQYVLVDLPDGTRVARRVV